jgi:hypothetical protein
MQGVLLLALLAVACSLITQQFDPGAGQLAAGEAQEFVWVRAHTPADTVALNVDATAHWAPYFTGRESAITPIPTSEFAQFAAEVNAIPPAPGRQSRFEIEGRPALRREDVPEADYRTMSLGYLELLRVPLRAGRPITATQPGSQYAEIFRRMAARVWEKVTGESALRTPPRSRLGSRRYSRFGNLRYGNILRQHGQRRLIIAVHESAEKREDAGANSGGEGLRFARDVRGGGFSVLACGVSAR